MAADQRTRACRWCRTQVRLPGLASHERRCGEESEKARAWYRAHRSWIVRVRKGLDALLNGEGA